MQTTRSEERQETNTKEPPVCDWTDLFGKERPGESAVSDTHEGESKGRRGVTAWMFIILLILPAMVLPSQRQNAENKQRKSHNQQYKKHTEEMGCQIGHLITSLQNMTLDNRKVTRQLNKCVQEATPQAEEKAELNARFIQQEVKLKEGK